MATARASHAQPELAPWPHGPQLLTAFENRRLAWPLALANER